MSVRTLVGLTAPELVALVLAAPLVVVTRLVLWLLPSRTIVRAVQRLAQGRRPSSVASERWAVPMWAVAAVSRRVPGASCLTQALAGLLLLRVYGYAARLCVGVGFDGSGEFRAHAWLESREGRVLIGRAGVNALERLKI